MLCSNAVADVVTIAEHTWEYKRHDAKLKEAAKHSSSRRREEEHAPGMCGFLACLVQNMNWIALM